MATADSGAKPLQSAMKMAKVAIQLDGGNKHKVGAERRDDSVYVWRFPLVETVM